MSLSCSRKHPNMRDAASTFMLRQSEPYPSPSTASPKSYSKTQASFLLLGSNECPGLGIRA